MARKTVEHILVQLGVSEQSVQECAREGNGSISATTACLINKGIITHHQLAQAYAQYANLPLVEHITDQMADVTILAKIPLKFLRDNTVMPIKQAGTITLLMANPMLVQLVDDVSLALDSTVVAAVAPQPVIISAINKYYPLEGTKEMIDELKESEDKQVDEEVSFDQIEDKDILTMASEAPIIKLVNHILFQATKRAASDIHIEPFEKEVRVRYRIDGIMYDVMTPPKRIQAALASRIKIMANLNIAEKRAPQDGRIQIKVADKAIDIRVSVLPVSFGERIVMRLLDKTRTFSKLEEIGFSERDRDIIFRCIERPNGIIYVTGPTGSGKTTTLYSILGYLNKPDMNLITVEDPVEYQIAGIGQVQVNEKAHLTFATALRSILRQDPDIIMIGETRDQETAQIAVQAALTGHLVLSTLHTNSAPASITRLLDMGVEPFLIASSVVLIIAQRLVRRLCDICKKAYQPSEQLLARFNLDKSKTHNTVFYQAVGCDECLKTGYKGRFALFEVMEMTEAVSRSTMLKADTAIIRSQAIKDGMTLLIQDGLRHIKEGTTTMEEVLSVATLEYDIEA